VIETLLAIATLSGIEIRVPELRVLRRQVKRSYSLQSRQTFRSGFGVNGGAAPRLGRYEPQDVRHLTARERLQIELLVPIALVVLARPRVAEAVRTDQERSVDRQRPFHPVGEELLAVSDVADDFVCTPLSPYRAAAKFVVGHSQNGRTKLGTAPPVSRDQVGNAQ
jgi:hypothetical protein